MMLRKLTGCCVIICLMIIETGCFQVEPAPKVVSQPQVEPLHLPDPVIIKHPQPAHTTTFGKVSGVPSQWLPPASVEKKWKAIVIHHSATDSGNATIFDKWHRENHDWDGVGYDFVIGNGSESGNGQIEVTFRWRQQRVGAHCKTPNNWANRSAVGICLVGNFDKTVPTKKQMQALVRLTRFLQRRYHIPKSRIYGHRTTPGARITHCPGMNFPMAKFKSMLP